MKASIISFILRALYFLGFKPNHVDKIKYFTRRYILKTIPSKEKKYKAQWRTAQRFLQDYELYSNPGERRVCYEIGSGRELTIALFISRFFSEMFCLDIVENVKPDLLNHSLNIMQKNGLIGDFTTATKQNYKNMLADHFSICYMAPADARDTPFKDDYVDLIISNAVFEHISEADLPKVFAECHRVLSGSGVMVASISYADHFYFIDRSITPYNFLKYSEAQWKKYDMDSHVNRLRHSDFVRLFSSCGFMILKEEKRYPENYEKMIENFPFAKEMTDRYSLDDLSVTSGYFVLKK